MDTEHGQLVRDSIANNFREGNYANLSFKNIGVLTTAFLNTSVGSLYADFSSEFICNHLKAVDLTYSGELQLLQYVVDNAKKYYSDPDNYKNPINECLE